MSVKGKTLGLFEFLEEAELQQYYNAIKNFLQVQSVHQLKYVVEEDLFNIGMSKPEARRLKTFYNKVCPQNYASKLRRFLRPSSKKDEARQEFLLGEDAKEKRYSTLSNVKVPCQHIIPSESLTLLKELGSGEFGVVQQGVWTDDEGMRHQVAVKCLSRERMQNSTLAFLKEYEIMQAMDHQNVVRLYGLVMEAQALMLVTELAMMRSLLECLKEISLRSTFNVSCLAGFAVQIGRGMRYLEAKRLIHRDLAARNILVFSKDCVKVSDFGLSRALGVGKDYYQTNFTASLKLPIAWCAPESINFLKFTSASDVWAFGVTLWEMFTYGFQPWAALTGQQILEAIDQPRCQRLEEPVHCPRDHYAIMLQTWRHEPSKRPTFEQLCSILEEAKPEQVQAVVATNVTNSSGNPGVAPEMLEFDVGDVITVLDKGEGDNGNTIGLWKGALNNGRVGLFSPDLTVAYVGTLPSQGNHSKWHNEDLYQSANSFQRSSLRGSKGSSRRKISRDMISAPRGDVQHTGHIGPDGAIFGDVGFATGGHGLGQGSGGHPNGGDVESAAATGPRGKKVSSSSNPEVPCASMPSLTRADSDASEHAPLICGNNQKADMSQLSGGGGGGGGVSELVNQETSQAPPTKGAASRSPSTAGGANKNPRMGYAIGYLRKAAVNQQGDGSAAAGTAKDRPHEYQTIVDEELGGPLDLGPSLMDEVFNELDSSKPPTSASATSTTTAATATTSSSEKKSRHHHNPVIDLVSSTLTLSSRHKSRSHSEKQQATVKPIKASDEKALDKAIAMANLMASKSMHDLDKRHLGDREDEHDFYYGNKSPLTPGGSPAKKFHFWFPSKTPGSPRGERRPFSEEVNAHADLGSLLTPGAIDAYKVLIEGVGGSKSSLDQQPQNEASSPGHLVSSSQPDNAAPARSSCLPARTLSRTGDPPPSNPLPLPPKSQKLTLMAPPKRHVRKNPLIIPSGTAVNLLRKEAVTEVDHYDLQVSEPPYKQSQSVPSPEPLYPHHEVSQTNNQEVNGNFPRDQQALRSIPSEPHSSSSNSNNNNNNNMDPEEVMSSSSFVNSVCDRYFGSAVTSTTRHLSLSRHSDNSASDQVWPSPEADSSSAAFEAEIACSIDALDHLEEIEDNELDVYTRRREEKLPLVEHGDHHSTSLEDIGPYGKSRKKGSSNKGKARGANADEVRIMQKVLGSTLDSQLCLKALDITDWNVHHAIKLLKVKNLIKAPGLTDSEMKVALQTRDWDVAKAARVLMKKIKE